LQNPFLPRLEKIWDWMAREGLALVMFEDCEERRDKNIFWLTGHPGDALLFLSVERKCLLVPWDINLAKIYSKADMIIAYGDFDRLPLEALRGAVRVFAVPAGSRIEIPPVTPYPLFLNYAGEFGDFDILCRERSALAKTRRLRAVKDEAEIKIYRKAAEFTNVLIDLLEKNVRNGKIKTEADAALMIEFEARKMGCEGTGFETIAAGPERSFGIHAFPPWTRGAFGGPGLSILDFGLRYGGRTTDVTLTFAKDLNSRQEKMVSLTEKAARLAASMAHNGTPTRDIAAAADEFFAKAKKQMPHALGHGIGLEEHEFPVIRNREDNNWVLEPGMVFTLEPGLYDPSQGGCRLENDFLVTEGEAEMLTEARIIRL
jgi:Xaa-Pro dipeptidase